MIRFNVLGPLEVWHGADPVVVPAGRARLLLATLLLRANRPVSVEELVDRLWDGGAPNPDRARATLHMVVRRLRQALGEANVVRTTTGGYLAELPADALDLHRFRDLAGRGRFAEALGLWRGTPLSDVPSDALHRDEVVPLLEEHLTVLERRVDADLAAGRTTELVPELRLLTREHPLRERFWGQLIEALAGSGRQAEALAAYREVSELLVEELGTDPGPELREVHQRVLVGDPAPQPAPSRTVPRHLPPDVPTFSGRADDLAALDALVPAGGGPAAVVISAIEGTAGVGKTALAVRWAHRLRDRFPDGQLFVNFRSHTSDRPITSHEAMAQLLRGLGLAPGELPPTLDEQVNLYRTVLADRRVLVLLDDVASSEQVRPLLPANPACLVVVTSRNDLRGLAVLNDAHVLRLGALSPADALALLGRIIGEHRVAAEPEAAAELLELCAHLPLAIRIVAADLAHRPGAGLAEHAAELRASDRLRQLAVPGDPDAAVLTAFSRSYSALEPPARELFRRLGSAHGTDFGVAEAAALAGVDAGVARGLLDHLVGVHLVEERSGGRFGLHDLLRLYAADRGRAEDGPAGCRAARDRLHDHYLGSVEAAAAVLYPGILRLSGRPAAGPHPEVRFADENAAQEWLATHLANLVAAVEHTAEHGPRSFSWTLTSGMTWYCFMVRADASWRIAAHAALAAAVAEGDRLAEAAMSSSIGTSCYAVGDFGGAVERFAHAVELFHALDEPDWEATAANNLGASKNVLGDIEGAARHFRQALEAKRRLGSKPGEATALLNLGVLAHELGQLDAAFEHFNRSLELCRELGVTRDLVEPLANVGSVLMEQGDLHGAAHYIGQSVDTSREVGVPYLPAMCLRAELELELGHVESASELVGEVTRALEKVVSALEHAYAQQVVARIALRTGELRQALAAGELALAAAVEAGYRTGEVTARIALAEAWRRLGDHRQAWAHVDAGTAQLDAGVALMRRGHLLIQSAHLFLLEDDLRRARETAELAVDVLTRSGQRLYQVRALWLLASVLSAAGDHDEADRRRRRAREVLAGLGLPDDVVARELPAAADRSA